MVMGLWSLIGLLSVGVGCSLYFWWRTGRRLAQSECAHHILFHHGYHFLAVLDAKGIVLQLNESAQQMLDCTAKEVTGKPLAALSIFAQQEEFRQKMLRGLAAAMKGEPGGPISNLSMAFIVPIILTPHFNLFLISSIGFRRSLLRDVM